MAQQRIVWTVLPHGRATSGPFAGRLRVSIVASPRLTPQAANEQELSAFPEWLDWPSTLSNVTFHLRIGAEPPVDLDQISKSDSALWARLFNAGTPVAGFQFKDMSLVNLRSFAVRNVLRLLRKHYGALAVQSTSTHPTLLPWKNAHPNLKGFLTELGTRTQFLSLGDRQIEFALPGFSRFFDGEKGEGLEERLGRAVFGPWGGRRGSRTGLGDDGEGNPVPGGEFVLRALPPDWSDAALGGPDAAVMAQFSTAGEYTLYQANRFYRREPLTKAQFDQLNAQGQLRRPKNINVPPGPKIPDYDFHRIVASFADYPELLRALGLIIDCVLPANSKIDQQLNALPQVEGVMGLVLTWSSAHDPESDSCPRTAWLADKARFSTRPRTADHELGLLRLQGADDRWHIAKHTDFDVYQVEPDGAALKTVNFLLSAQNLVAKSLSLGAAGEVTYTTGDKQPVAALRSAGLGVSRHGRAVAIAESAASAALKNQAIQAGAATSKDILLFTEDVLRGYRVDVLPLHDGVADRWYSLCRRHGTYRFVGSVETIKLPDDEGYVKGASTTSTASAAVDPDDHYLHESLFRWTGWSLVTPRPGRTLRSRVDPASGVQGEAAEDVHDEVSTGGNGLAVSYVSPERSLPRLRFGGSYRFRARIVDLAGNSLHLDDPSLVDDPNATEPVTFWRFEPVDPPALVHRARTSEGESLERMVIRSNWDADTTAYLTSAPFAAARALPASADFEYTAINERHVAPPKSSQLQCEQHGLFDAFFSNPADIKMAYGIAAREAGTLYDPGPSTNIELVTPTSLQNVATTTAVPPQLPTPDNPTGDRLAPGQYVIHREALVETPYLPDSAAGGLALRAMPGHTLPGVTGPMILGPSAAVVRAPNEELVVVVAYGKEWPDTLGLRIVLAERPATLADPPCTETFADDGVPKWDEDNRLLTLFVAKGRIFRLRYSTFVHRGFLDTLGLPDWVGSAERPFVRAMAQVGCAWMITPYRALVLVHATQQPVCLPEFLGLSVARQPGDQHAALRSQLQMHGPSTGKFEVEAAWKEWVDDVEKPGPELVDSRGQLGEIVLPENHVNVFALTTAVDAQQSPPTGQVPATSQPRARGDRHELGDTKFRLIHYTIRATTRFREYLPAALYEQQDEVTRVGPIAEGQAMQVGAPDDPGAPVLPIPNSVAPNTVVPASAPPDEPHIVYVVPTFRWVETAGSGTLDTTRFGNGLRVWLERPWFSSGDGELLGVVILGHDRPFTDIPTALVPYVTQWGLDPLWDTALPKYRTRVSDFPARVADEQVSLRELASTIVRVIGHRVRWDESRSLWYCDIDLDPGTSYMPFVRLALVRYQPNALPDSKISKVSLAAFSQVLPRRRAVFQRNATQLTFRLYGNVPKHGPMQFPMESAYEDVSFPPPLGLPGESGRNKVELVLQTRDPAIDSDLEWSDVKVLASRLVAPAGEVVRPAAVQPAGGVDVRAARVEAPATLRDRLGRHLDIPSAVNLGAFAGLEEAVTPAAGIEVGPITAPPIWEQTVTLPDVGSKPARVTVREYERYYADRTVPEIRGSLHRRRVVEERLVYTAFFGL